MDLHTLASSPEACLAQNSKAQNLWHSAKSYPGLLGWSPRTPWESTHWGKLWCFLEGQNPGNSPERR